MSVKQQKTVKAMAEAIKYADAKKPQPYDATATVVRTEGNIAWVHFDGGAEETPVRKTINAKEGDIVQVRVGGGDAWIVGNATAPPTDDSRADVAIQNVTVLNNVVANTIEANNARFTVMEADTAKVHNLQADELEATVAYIGDLTANNITAEDITADHATIGAIDAESITATVAYIEDLTADNITAQDISADHAFVNNFEGNYAHITNGVIDNAKIGYADVNDLNAHYAHITQGVIDNAKISYADVNDLNAHYAEIDGANIDTATIRNAWVDQLMVQTGLIAHEGTVYELDAIQVNASKIKAGTLDVERLIVTVSGQKYLVHIDPSTGTPSYEKLDGDVIEDLTITADKIVAGAITAEKITTENIVGSGGWINLRNGTFQYTNATSGEGITWDGTHLTINGSVTIVNSNYYTKSEADTLLGAKANTSDVYTKSDFSITPSAIISKVNANELNLASTYAVCSTGASTTAKVASITPSVTGWALYTGASINVKFTNNNTATAPTLNVNSTGAKRIYAYTGTSALTEAEYKWKAGDTITFFYDGTYWRIQDSTKLTRMSTAETSITQTANSITSLASNTSTYTKPDGTTGTNSMYTAINQNAQSITTLIGRADGVDTLIRAYSSGVLVGKTSQTIGALVNASGSFDVVPVTWSGNTPTVGTGSLATFGSTVRVGATNTGNVQIQSSGVDIYGGNGTTLLMHVGYGSTKSESGEVNAPFYLFGTRASNTNIGMYSFAEGQSVETSGYNSHAEGKSTSASGGYSHAEGESTTASGVSSHAEGNNTQATNAYSHAEGRLTEASGYISHAEGFNTVALGGNSHAEGSYTEANNSDSHAEGFYSKANGTSSHAEGSHTEANGSGSHASGYYTIANGFAQTVIGSYNIADTTSAFIIGNGSSSARSNALTVDGSGNVNIPTGADYKINGTGINAKFDNYLPLSGGTLTGNLYINGSVNVKNGSGINSYNGSNTLRTLAFISSTDNYWYGSGSYDNSEGSAYYEGNEVTIRSRGAVNITAPSGVSLAGGLNVTGSVKLSAGYTFDGITSKSSSTSGSWANTRFRFLDADGTAYAWLGAYGTGNTFSYMYLGANAYNGNNLRVYDDGHIWANGIVNNGTYNALYKITDATVSVPAGSAGNISSASYSITAQSGYKAVGIVGISLGSFNVRPLTYYIESDTSIRAGFTRVATTSSAYNVVFKILWLKATSA